MDTIPVVWPIDDTFTPVKDSWSTADDIKQQRHEFEFEQFTGLAWRDNA